MNPTTLALSMPGGMEWVIIFIVALLLFGRRLPEVARSVGRSIVEFKKGLKDVKEEIDLQSRIEPPTNAKLEHKSETTSATSSETASKST